MNLETLFYGNSLQLWLTALLTALLAFILLRLLRRELFRRLKAFAERTETNIDDLLADLLAKTRFFTLLLLALYLGSLVLMLPPELDLWLSRLAVLVLLLQAAIWGNTVVEYLVTHYIRFESEAGEAPGSAAAIAFMGKLALWTIALLLLLDNWGFDITALITGLGISGIAVALAVQNILGDLFASLSILLDKPFVVGDFIVVDQYMGTVEYIGLKTTRVRSNTGEQLIFSNGDLLKARLRNFKRMRERRALLNIGVIYQTPVEKLARIPNMIREIIEKQELVRFDRAHFKGFGPSSLDFEVVYWVLEPDYKTFMDCGERINLALMRKFQQEGIEFAYPTQTLFLSTEEPLKVRTAGEEKEEAA